MATQSFVPMSEDSGNRLVYLTPCLEERASASLMWLSGQHLNLGHQERLACWELVIMPVSNFERRVNRTPDMY